MTAIIGDASNIVVKAPTRESGKYHPSLKQLSDILRRCYISTDCMCIKGIDVGSIEN